MKAIRVHEFGAPEVMRLEEVPDPEPSAGQVLVRVRAAGVNPVDAYVRSGQYARTPALPYTPGSDAAGTVEKVGDGVRRLARGDRVYTSGTVTGAYAELLVCEEWQAHRLPGSVTYVQGAALGVPYATAYRALFHRAQARPGETVFVHGATGGVGIAAVQLARAAGMHVIGTGGTEDGRRLVHEAGAEQVLDHSAEGYLDALAELTDGRGVDVVLEMLANVNLGRDATVLAPHGRIVVIGSRGPVEINPRDLMGRDADIRGMTLFNATRDDLASIHAALRAGLANGTLHPVVGREFPLAKAPQAHEEVMHGHGAHGKVVLVM
ncbi:MAG TPA: NADPH:quinone reductase [Gemmatimonadaceae bacterium]|nr:NADPH:quinone reductase [Gemmatimonadaceae bacterium]